MTAYDERVELMEQVAQTIRARRLFSRGQTIVVAVSGGVDSMVLLRLLHELSSKNDWRLVVAHFNHQLRGRSSDADERLVRATAEALDLPFARAGKNVRAYARKNGLSLEMAARELRHHFLAGTARKFKADRIALAHHADDQVELFFLRLLRGSGDGLAGMRWQSASPMEASIRLVRPLLGVGKAELEAYARRCDIQFRFDASNASPDHLRNRVRQELLPLLAKNYQPALNKVILRTMDILAAEGEWAVGAVPRDEKLASARFGRLPLALQRRWLQQRLLALGVPSSFELVEHLREQVEIPYSLDSNREILRRRGGSLVLRRRQSRESRLAAAGKSLVLDVGSRCKKTAVFSGLRMAWEIERLERFACPKPAPGVEGFDVDKLGKRIVFRNWRAGDRFQPIGMKTAVKLQDLFVNAKIARERRGWLVVATTQAGAIFWVEGLRIGEVAKLTPETRRKLVFRWVRVDDFGCGESGRMV